MDSDLPGVLVPFLNQKNLLKISWPCIDLFEEFKGTMVRIIATKV